MKRAVPFWAAASGRWGSGPSRLILSGAASDHKTDVCRYRVSFLGRLSHSISGEDLASFIGVI